MNSNIATKVVGEPIDRIDGRLKVTGAATFASEFPVENVAHAVLITSTIARGHIVSMNVEQALRAPGVLSVLTPFNAPKLKNVPLPGPHEPPKPNNAGAPGSASGGAGAATASAGASGGAASGTASGGSAAGTGQPPRPPMRVPTVLQDAWVRYNGQPIGVVVAESFEQAVAAAELVRVQYVRETPVLNDRTAPRNAPSTVVPLRGERTSKRGDATAALSSAAVKIDATYRTPLENHNPMEAHNTLARWDGDTLTVYESTQGIFSVRNTLASAFGLSPDKVRVVSHFTGGGFGSKGGAWSHEILAAMAARQAKRPVKLLLTRRQMFGPVGGRPRTEQRITLGADANGKLVATKHSSTSTTSTLEDWLEPSISQTMLLYACPNLETEYNLVRLNIGSPTFMRAPGESTGTFALESAMDELAVALKMDPMELRLRNYAEQDPESGKPWSSKALRECYASAAARFGWSKRNSQTGATRDGDWLVGSGMATATYPARRNPAGTLARMTAEGRVLIRAGSQEIGCGTYTVMTQIAADALGLPAEQIRFELGETSMPENPASTGSVTAASTGTAVHEAATLLRSRLVQLAINDAKSPLHGALESQVQVSAGKLSLASDDKRSETYADIVMRNGGRAIDATANSRAGEEQNQYSMHSFGTVFAEVRVHQLTREIRVSRVVTAHGIGKVLNAKTAKSQIIGGVVWGIGQALLEHTMIDPHSGRYVNADFGEYHVPINADVGAIDVAFVEEMDAVVNPIGVKGAGEIGITGVAAAIANAVYHATGIRVRELPITLDKLLV